MLVCAFFPCCTVSTNLLFVPDIAVPVIVPPVLVPSEFIPISVVISYFLDIFFSFYHLSHAPFYVL